MAVAAATDSRREELRAFLRSRRARLSPADVGLPDQDGARRRTPGLRREELAGLAGSASPGTRGWSRAATSIPHPRCWTRWRARCGLTARSA